MEELVTSPELCRLAGISYRQLDYWTRQGVLVASRPARGSGSFRGWTVDEVAMARVCGQLAKLGAGAAVLRSTVRAVTAYPALWAGRAVIAPDGTVAPESATSRREGWVVDLSAARVWVGAEPVVFDGDTAAVG